MTLALFGAAALLGAVVGAAELIARYRESPERALLCGPGLIYLGLNAAASTAALFTVRTFDWQFAVTAADPLAVPLVQVAAAGFGAMAIFRSSLFSVRVGDKDVGVGPAGILQIVLDAADRALDRKQAGPRAQIVSQIMSGVDFERSHTALSAFCLGLMQNVTVEEQQRLGTEIAKLANSELDGDLKTLSLGLLLLDLVGEDVLNVAVQELGGKIRRQPDGAAAAGEAGTELGAAEAPR